MNADEGSLAHCLSLPAVWPGSQQVLNCTSSGVEDSCPKDTEVEQQGGRGKLPSFVVSGFASCKAVSYRGGF